MYIYIYKEIRKIKYNILDYSIDFKNTIVLLNLIIFLNAKMQN